MLTTLPKLQHLTDSCIDRCQHLCIDKCLNCIPCVNRMHVLASIFPECTIQLYMFPGMMLLNFVNGSMEGYPQKQNGRWLQEVEKRRG